MLKYLVRTTLDRKLHESFSQIEYELLVDNEHKVREIFIDQLRSIMDNDVVLLEDDIILCRNFKERIETIISSRSDDIINFYTIPRIPFLSQYRPFVYNQCTYYSSKVLRDIVAYFDSLPEKPIVSPEKYIQLYLGDRRVYNYRPCLVQHIDNGSLLGHNVKIPRRTPFFIDYLEDLNIPYEKSGIPENRQKLIDYMNKQFEEIDARHTE